MSKVIVVIDGQEYWEETLPGGTVVQTLKGGVQPIPKTVYTRSQFASLLKPKLKQIQDSVNDDIVLWLFNIQGEKTVDLNSLESWFTDGIAAMVSNAIITQAQADTFLEL